jgi:hypothetical protein
MNVLTIGFTLPNPAVDNYNVLTAPSYSDYEALVIDPASITDSVRELLSSEKEIRAWDDRPVVNGATTASALSAADLILRRADETRLLLEAGGVVVVITRPNAVESGLLGFEGCDRYSWLPAPAGAAWGTNYLRPSDGVTVRIVADEHPFSGVLRELRKDTTYRAVIDERLLGAAESATIIARGGSNAVISASFKVLNGLVVLLPAVKIPAGSTRTKLAKPFIEAVNWLVGGAESDNPPIWAKSMAVPGLEQIEAELEEAETALKEAQDSADVISENQRRLSSHRRLLWSEGSGFQEAVRSAFDLLGFTSDDRPGDALSLKSDDTTLYVETESSTEEVKEWPYVRLQRRLEEKLLGSGSQPRGVIVVNGQRGQNPSKRPQEFSNALRNAAENYGYTLLTGQTMFALVQRALGGAEEADLTGIRRRLASHSGLLDADTALGEAEEEQQDAGPIF